MSNQAAVDEVTEIIEDLEDKIADYKRRGETTMVKIYETRLHEAMRHLLALEGYPRDY